MRLGSALLVSFVVAALFPNRVEASPIIFTDRAAFEVATRPNVLVPFDSVKSPFGDPPVFCNFLSFDCLAVADHILIIETDDALPRPDPFGGNIKLGFGHGFGLSLVGKSEFTAIGFDVVSSPQALLFIGGLAFHSPNGFLGFVFPTSTTEVGLHAQWPDIPFQSVTIDNVAIKTVPEPSTLLLLGSAFALLCGMRLPRRKS